MQRKQAHNPAFEVQRSRFKAVLCLSVASVALVGTALSQPVLQFAAAGYPVAESAGSVTLAVQRTGDLINAATVDFATMDGTATNGLKYCATIGTLEFAAGETNKAFVVSILNNGFAEGTKSFRVILGNPSGGAVLGTRTNATVSITDNDLGVQFAFAAYSAAEDSGAAMMSVVRGDDGDQPITVEVATSDLTALRGRDYAGTTNTVSLSATERSKLVAVPILNNGRKEADRTFRVTLSNPTGATLASQKTTTVTIVDNDQGFQFESTTYTVAEDAGAVLVNVLRGTDSADSATTVDYAVADLSATNGLDYGATNGTLAFAPGEMAKVIPVPLLNDGIKEGAESFRLTLSHPTGGAVVGSRTTTTVSILDNDSGVGFDSSSCSVCEKAKAGNVTLTVVRGNDGALGPFTVDYATVDGSALAGQDYQSISGTLRFAENETLKSLTIPILPDSLAEGTETLQVTLSNPTGGATLGIATTTVGIKQSEHTLAPPVGGALTIHQSYGVNVLAWTGGGQLQRADRVTGPWQTLTGAKSPWTVQPRTHASFYRVGGARPVSLYVPSSYDGRTAVPLVILLHGLGSSGSQKEAYMQLRPLAEARGFLYCYPDALPSPLAGPFWNYFTWSDVEAAASRFHNADDVGYLRGLIEEVASQFALDRKRVYLVGHSNGGAMAYRMACECADLVAGVASLAGLRALAFADGEPSEPVNILHIHGTADEGVAYWGAAWNNPPMPLNTIAWPGAMRNLEIWADHNGASSSVTDPEASLDLTTDVAGLDTVVTRYTRCPPGGAVELWTINGGGHSPALSPHFSPRVIDWLLAHPKP
jgi:poly(3-hydroxybutyrate) depolymerase